MIRVNKFLQQINIKVFLDNLVIRLRTILAYTKAHYLISSLTQLLLKVVNLVTGLMSEQLSFTQRKISLEFINSQA